MKPADDLQNKLVVETPENIFLEFELAGLGSRFLAYLVDTIVQSLILLAVFYVAGLLVAVSAAAFRSAAPGDTAQKVLIALAMFLVYEGYFIYFETRWQGQSVGKKLLNLRVVKDGGFPVSFWDVVIRNVFRVVDALPPLAVFPSYGLGSAVLLANRQAKRIGDYVAGTLVIKERPYQGFEHFSAIQTNPEYIQQIRIGNLHRLEARDYYLLREFFFRKNSFPPSSRQNIASQLAGYLSRKLDVPAGLYTNPVKFLDDLMLLTEHRRA